MITKVFVLCAVHTLLCSSYPTNSAEQSTQCESNILLGAESNANVNDVSSWDNGVLYFRRFKFASIEKLCEPFPDGEAVDLQMDGIGLRYLEPGVFVHLSGPFKADLSNNALQHIKEETFSNTSISSLDLRYNRIETISPTAFDNMDYLEVLFLDHNHIEGWHSEWFTNTPRIHEVHVSHNLLSAIPAHALKNIKGCHYINGLKVLSLIDFSQNRIAAIHEDAFEDQRIFDSINLEGNSLTNISPKIFAHMEHLRNLTLRSNPMTCPSEETFLSWFNIQHIQADDTNWDDSDHECSDRQNHAKAKNPHSSSVKFEIPDDQCS